MKKIYYDIADNFVKDLEKKLNKSIEKNEKENKIKIENEIIKYEEKDIGVRSFSVPYFVENQTIINYDGNNKELINKIEDICTAYTDIEIEAIEETMPILKKYSEERKKNLEGVAIIWRDHFLEENVGLLTSMVRMGVQPEDVLAIDKGDSTKHRQEITATFKKLGYQVDVLDNTAVANDILIEDGVIIKLQKEILAKADNVIDCTGLVIIPGMIDMHCHLREPGFEYKETIETGSKSAVKGGFTTICPMPNTNPTPDSAFILEKILAEAKRVNLCNILPYGSVSKGEKGEELTDFEELKKAGAVAFSDDGMPVINSRMMRQAIIKANSLGTFVASHCEEKSVADGAINAGKIQEELGVKGVLPEAEEIMAAREIVISETNNVRAHICHISTKTSVNMIRDAKKRGVKITCETCPHYFCFTVDEVLTSGTNAKMNPPLRDEKDRQAIIEALKDGTIDAIITDHAPHSEEEKERELSKAPNGIIGFETALPAINTYLIDKNLLTEMDMVKLTSYNPAKLLNLDKGEIKEGKIADLTIYDPEESYIYTKDMIVSKSKNTPFIGKKLKGKVKYTIVNGNIVYKD